MPWHPAGNLTLILVMTSRVTNSLYVDGVASSVLAESVMSQA